MIIGSKDQFAIEFRPGPTPGADETSFWLCGENIGTSGEFVTTEDVISLLEGAASFRGKRDNPRLFAMQTKELVQALDSALFTGDDAELDALAELEQWGRHVVRLPIAGVKCYAVENDGICRFVARRAVAQAPLECRAKSGAIDDVLDQAAQEVRRFDAGR